MTNQVARRDARRSWRTVTLTEWERYRIDRDIREVPALQEYLAEFTKAIAPWVLQHWACGDGVTSQHFSVSDRNAEGKNDVRLIRWECSCGATLRFR